MTRAALAAVAVALLPGCVKLDPFLYARQRTDHYVFNPQGPDAESTIDPGQIGEPEPIQVNGQVQIWVVYVTATTQPPRGYGIFFHGNGPHMANDGQFAYAKRLANLGYDVMAVDYRGFGMSTDVAPTEAGIEEDTRAALASMTARVGTDRLFYYGHSLGASIALQRATIDPPRALVMESSFASIQEFEGDATLMDFPDDYVAWDSWATSTRIQSMSRVLFLHGLADDYVRPEFSERLYQRAQEPKKLVLVEGADHGNVASKMGAAYATTVHDWIDQFIPP